MSNATNIGFDFEFNCVTYTQFRASSNGFISLGNSTTNSFATNDLSITGNGPIIAPLWDDLQTGTAGVTYLVSGSAGSRVLTVEWRTLRWNRNAGGWVISFQAKLYEGTNVIEFCYTPSGTNVNSGSASIGISGDRVASDFYSVSGINGTTVATYGTQTSNINTKPATNTLYRFTPANQIYISSTVTQVTGDVSRCNTQQIPIICLKVDTRGCESARTVTEIRMNMSGTGSLGNIADAHIYYTGNSSGFSAINEFSSGSLTVSSSTFSVSGSQTLASGSNYFWVVYDLIGNPANGALDAQCSRFTHSGTNTTPSVTNPAGSRNLVNCFTAPGGITESSFWVKGNAGTSSTTNNTRINSWNDQSGNSRHATNGTTDNQPMYYDNATNNLNYNPIVNFNAAGQDEDDADFMDINTSGMLSPNSNPYEVYAVLLPGSGNSSTPGKFLFSGEAGSNNFNSFDIRASGAINDSWNMNDLIVANTWQANKPLMLTFDYNYQIRESFKAGTSIGTRAGAERTSSIDNNALAYQRTGGIEFYDGSIAEIITYANTAHSTTKRHKVESYLATKYGITLSHNYLASEGTRFWNIAQDANFNNNIIGIARDNTSNLMQKQSKSTTGAADILRIHIGPSLSANQANNSGSFTASDLSFFMVGANIGVPLNLGSSDKPAGICCRLEREWLVQRTNFTNTTVTLVFDFTAITPGTIPMNAGDLRLLVDDNAEFSNATILNTPTVTITAAASVATVTVPVSVFSTRPYFTLASVSNNTILPLEILSFTGVCRDEEAQLKWTIAGEVPNDIIVERSADRTTFTAVGTVQKNVTGSYGWTDRSPLAGNGYYRLKAVNEQGAIRYSTIVAVAGCNSKAVRFSTNPTTRESLLTLQLPQSGMGEISLYDMVGRRVDVPGLTGHRNFAKGVHNLPVNVPGTGTGWYTLHVVMNGERYAFRMLKK